MADILFVDDDPGVRETVSSIFEMWETEVHIASSGVEALAMLATRGAIRTILTDINMPGMDGCELAERARALRSDLTIIAVTGNPDRARSSGERFDDIVPKPFNIDQLRSSIEPHRASTATG